MLAGLLATVTALTLLLTLAPSNGLQLALGAVIAGGALTVGAGFLYTARWLARRIVATARDSHRSAEASRNISKQMAANTDQHQATLATLDRLSKEQATLARLVDKHFLEVLEELKLLRHKLDIDNPNETLLRRLDDIAKGWSYIENLNNILPKKLDELTEGLTDFERLHAQIEDLDSRFEAVNRSVNLSARDTVVSLESTFSLLSAMDSRAPLDRFGGWAVRSEVALHLVRLIWLRKPNLVLELGSGVSTVVLAQALKHIGHGRIVSMDHDAHFAQATRNRLKMHGLSDVAEVVHAPLCSTEVRGNSYRWYDLGKLKLGNHLIEICFVDGPPGNTGQLARYPALPLLQSFMAPDALMLVDDSDRSDEAEMLQRWKKENPGSWELLDSPIRNLGVLSRTKTDS